MIAACRCVGYAAGNVQVFHCATAAISEEAGIHQLPVDRKIAYSISAAVERAFVHGYDAGGAVIFAYRCPVGALLLVRES